MVGNRSRNTVMFLSLLGTAVLNSVLVSAEKTTFEKVVESPWTLTIIGGVIFYVVLQVGLNALFKDFGDKKGVKALAGVIAFGMALGMAQSDALRAWLGGILFKGGPVVMVAIVVISIFGAALMFWNPFKKKWDETKFKKPEEEKAAEEYEKEKKKAQIAARKAYKYSWNAHKFAEATQESLRVANDKSTEALTLLTEAVRRSTERSVRFTLFRNYEGVKKALLDALKDADSKIRKFNTHFGRSLVAANDFKNKIDEFKDMNISAEEIDDAMTVGTINYYNLLSDYRVDFERDILNKIVYARTHTSGLPTVGALVSGGKKNPTIQLAEVTGAHAYFSTHIRDKIAEVNRDFEKYSESSERMAKLDLHLSRLIKAQDYTPDRIEE